MNIIKTYDFWKQTLAGGTASYNDGDVCLGYYRFKSKNHQNGGDPVAIWIEDDALACMVGDRLVENHKNVFRTADPDKDHWSLADLFSWCRKHPVSYEDYSARMDTGNWPGLHAAVSAQVASEEPGIGHNSQPMGAWEDLRDQIDALAAEVIKALKAGAAKTKEEADRAGDLADRLGKLHGKVKKAHDLEKAPHWEKCCEVDEKWRPLTEASAPYKDVKKTVITPFLIAETAKRNAKLEEERKEAARLVKEAEDAARAAEQIATDGALDGETEVQLHTATEIAEQKQKAADEATRKADQTAASTVKVGGTRGRSISLRTAAEYIVTDRRAAFAALKDQPGFLADIDAVILKHAKPIIAGGMPVAGVGTEAKQNAA